MKTLFYFLLLVTTNVFTQCRGSTYRRTIPNSPDFYLNNHCVVVESINNEFRLTVDTNWLNNTIHFTDYNFQINKNYRSKDTIILNHNLLSSSDTICFSTQDYYINKDKYFIAIEGYFSFYSDYRNIYWFDAISDSIYQTSTPYLEIIGQNDTSLFAYNHSKFKYNKQKFPKSSLVAITKDQIKMIQENFTKNLIHKNLVFYSPEYQISSFTKDTLKTDCETRLVKNVQVTYKDVIIDQFDYETDLSAFQDLTFTLENSSLIGSSSSGVYKKYFQGKLISDPSFAKIEFEHPVLKKHFYSFEVIDNYLVIHAKLPVTEMEGLINEGKMTANQIPLNPESNQYHYVLIYDVYTNEFLGYPKLIFDDL